MTNPKKPPQRPFKKDDLVKIRVGCRGYNLHRGELGRVTSVKKGVSRPVVVMFYDLEERYQPGDLERV